MTRPAASRREFLSTSTSAIGGGWLAAHLPLFAMLSACADEATERGDAFLVLGEGEARALTAFADRIFPPDDTPGASDANVVRFIDQALAGPFAGMRPVIGDGAADLDERARNGGASDFAALDTEGQIAVMREVEATPFFGNARLLVIAGMFSHPSHGGNRDGVGFELLQMEQASAFEPPFGYYDAEARGVEGEA